MAILGFRPEFRDQVEDGRKCRTYRMAKCIKKHCCLIIQKKIDGLEGNDLAAWERPNCYLICPNYEYRIKTGDTIHAYTGLRQRKYCKVNWCMDGQQGNDGRCQLNDVCSFQGAKLLRQDLPRCIDTYPIKLQDITEEDARLDGFERGYQEEFCEKECKVGARCQFICTPKDKLKTYFNAKPDTPIQAIIWEEIKGRNAGK